MRNPISQNQLQMFADPHEKGHREWNSFAAVREDRAGMYRVAMPQKTIVTKESGNVLRIIYPHSAHLHPAH